MTKHQREACARYVSALLLENVPRQRVLAAVIHRYGVCQRTAERYIERVESNFVPSPPMPGTATLMAQVRVLQQSLAIEKMRANSAEARLRNLHNDICAALNKERAHG